MSRFARTRRVFFLEEPLFENAEPHLRAALCSNTGVRVLTPILPTGLARHQILRAQQDLFQSMLREYGITDCIAWYYTPMAKEFTSVLRPNITVYDCMDELSAFAGAPAGMRENEELLFRDAELVFTGGASLFQAKRKQHASVHLFPSSVDISHFRQARQSQRDPDDQSAIPHPRFGYAGVIDERMDLELLRHVAAERPNWHIVLLGPVVKIDPASLPRGANIHYLGMKPYPRLPEYFSGWDIGILPFALNESTRFISPTKTPEYLAAGLKVISTPIRDVITPYGDLALVKIANNPSEFVRIGDSLLAEPPMPQFRARVDQFISQSSWDKTWSEMNTLIENAYALKCQPIGTGAELAPAIDPSTKGGALHV